jgi:hypothetical protein
VRSFSDYDDDHECVGCLDFHTELHGHCSSACKPTGEIKVIIDKMQAKGIKSLVGHTREQDEVDSWTIDLTAGI